MSLNDYITQKPIIQTERLRLRPLAETDVASMREWMGDKSIYKYWGKNAGKTDKDPSLLFKKETRPTKSFHLGIEHKDTEKIIGEIWVYLIENDRMAKIAIRLSPAFHSKGMATEATRAMTEFCFRNTELQRLWTDVDIRNIASVKVLEKCGYKREGCIRQGKMISCWCDYYIYGILKADMDLE